MGFVLPERKRPSYWDIFRALRRGMLYAVVPALVLVVAVTARSPMAPAATRLTAVVVSLPAAVYFARRILEQRTGYAMPWWLACVGVGAGCLVTPWGSAWLVREILSGTFGGEDLAIGPAPSSAPAAQPLLFQTGVGLEPPPVELPVATPFIEELPLPEALPALRVVPVPLAPEPAPVWEPEPEEPAALAPPEPVAAPAVALAAFEPELALELDPRVQAEPALVAAVPLVVEPEEIHELPAHEEEQHAFFLPPTELEPAAAHDPFATFWLDTAAPPPDGLRPGYLPPLTGLWRTPLGDTL
jgi:hypothetical protein